MALCTTKCVLGLIDGAATLDVTSEVGIATGSDSAYRGEACQHLDLDLVDLEVKGHFRIRKVQPEVLYSRK